MQDEVVIGDYGSEGLYASRLASTDRQRVFSFYVAGVEYDLIYRTDYDTETFGTATFAWCFNKDERKFIPVQYATGDTTLNQLVTGGVSAAVNVGKYVLLAGNTITPTWSPETPHADPDNQRYLAAWVRGGAYSRKFKLTLTRQDGTKLEVEYKTLSASYPELLDTTDILVSDTEYQKKVNDRVNAYNSEVTKWIGTAAEDITPENIATKLKDLLIAAGVTASAVSGTVVVDDTDFIEIEADDSGDGTLFRGVGNEVSAPDMVSTVHRVGKIVKVRPKHSNGDDALYLEALPKDEGGTGWTEVTWRECAGYKMVPQDVFIMGTVVDEVLYLASSAAKLAELTPGEHPTFKANAVGDDVSCPLPFFFGRRIDYLGMFQDRLIIGSGSTLFFSKPGDYFNWFRGSVLTIADNDPVEMFALGSEDDIIKTSTTFDRNLLFFGKRLQYTVNGRQPLTPRSASIVILSAHEDAIDAEPRNSGNYVFYCKSRNGSTSMHQIQIGMLADSPESYNVSQQLDKYLPGKPVEIVAVTAPNVVLLRTDAYRNRLYTYTYLDNAPGTERLFDAWARWEWGAAVGDIVGLSRHDGDVLVYALRSGLDRHGSRKVWIACERFVLDTGLSPYPYLDSLRPAASMTYPDDNTFVHEEAELNGLASIAFGDTTPFRLLGTPWDRRLEFEEQYPGYVTDAWVGLDYDAYATPTNPYARDKNDRAIVNGRLTLGRVSISVANTGGLYVDLETSNGTKRVATFNGRLLGRNTNPIGRQPIVTTSIPAPIGREVRQCKYTIRARAWLPLTVTAIEWTGQFFNNTRRI